MKNFFTISEFALYLNEYGTPYKALSSKVRAALSDLAALKFQVLREVGEAIGNTQTFNGIFAVVLPIVDVSFQHIRQSQEETMFDTHSDYALNKMNKNAIICPCASGEHIRLVREDFSSEEEFLRWKKWSDDNYHEAELASQKEDRCFPLEAQLRPR